jgi:hypothetical protein
MIMSRYVGATGKKVLFTMLSGVRLGWVAAGGEVGWEGSAVVAMPAS